MPKLTTSQYSDYKNKVNAHNIEWSNFVETGTYLGECIHEMEDFGEFKNLYTVELHEQTLNKTKQKRLNSKIKFYLGDSGDKISEICKELVGNSVFWLDAHEHHISVPGKADWANGIYAPLDKELYAINTICIDYALIIIDDIRSFGSGSLSHISPSSCLEIVKDRTLETYFDIDRLVILLASSYTTNINNDYISAKKV
jgi:hypothetical protein